MKRLFILAVLACAINACSKPETPPAPEPGNGESSKIPINITTTPWSKVTDAGYEEGDAVGIYIVNQKNGLSQSLMPSGNHADNEKFTYQGKTWKPQVQLYWKDQTTKADFYCYYPHTTSVSDIHSVSFTVRSDQSSIAGYKASEFLWGKKEAAAPSADPVQILTNHLMSNVFIVLKPGKGYNEENFAKTSKSVTITGVKNTARIDLATGKVSADAGTADIVPFNENGRYKALLIPQKITNAPMIQVKVNNDVYTLTQTVEFRPNTQYTCTLTINRIGEGVDIGIGGWEQDGNDYGGTLN